MAAPSDVVDIQSLWSAVRRALPRWMVFAFAAGAATYLVLAMVAPRYSSEAQLAIVATGAPEAPVALQQPSQDMASEPDAVAIDHAVLSTHVRALLSTDIAEQVVSRLQLGQRKEFNGTLGSLDLVDATLRMAGIGGPPAGASEHELVLRAYYRLLEIRAAKGGARIAIRFTSVEPQLAASIANAIAEIYRDQLAEVTTELAKAAASREEDVRSRAARELMRTGDGDVAGDGQRPMPVDARIVTVARAASAPVYPRTGPYVALVAATTLLLGLALVVTRALLVGARRASAAPRRDQHARAQARQAVERSEPLRAEPTDPISAAEPPRAMAQPVVRSADALAALLLDASTPGTGFRTLLTGAGLSEEPMAPARALAEALAREGAHVLLIDWSIGEPTLDGLFDEADLDGFAEVLDGTASLERVIRRIPGSSVHCVLAGSSLPAYPGAIDSDHVNLVLDALDEAYDHIVVVGRHAPACALFEAIEGRFDAGVLLRRLRMREDAAQPVGMSSFLGFEVDGLLVVDFETAEPVSERLQRMALARQRELQSA